MRGQATRLLLVGALLLASRAHASPRQDCLNNCARQQIQCNANATQTGGGMTKVEACNARFAACNAACPPPGSPGMGAGGGGVSPGGGARSGGTPAFPAITIPDFSGVGAGLPPELDIDDGPYRDRADAERAAKDPVWRASQALRLTSAMLRAAAQRMRDLRAITTNARLLGLPPAKGEPPLVRLADTTLPPPPPRPTIPPDAIWAQDLEDARAPKLSRFSVCVKESNRQFGDCILRCNRMVNRTTCQGHCYPRYSAFKVCCQDCCRSSTETSCAVCGTCYF